MATQCPPSISLCSICKYFFFELSSEQSDQEILLTTQAEVHNFFQVAYGNYLSFSSTILRNGNQDVFFRIIIIELVTH